jgi:helicase required for RNAi-mediated heterochromatin assembly 1
MAKLSYREEGDANAILQQHIYKSYENRAFTEEWRNLPEVPTSAEISPPSQNLPETANEESKKDERWNDYQKETLYNPNLPRNMVDGPWPSKAAYIGAHYQILREDAIAPLRRAVAEVKKNPTMDDDGETCIYTHVSGMAMGILRYSY